MVPELNREFPAIFDGHEDFISQCREGTGGYPAKAKRDFLTETGEGQVDLPRAMRGGLGGCFTSIYLEDREAEMNATGYAMDEMNDVFSIADRSEGRFRVCRTVAEVKAALADGAFASVVMFEGADPVSASLKELRVFYEAGLRVLAPTWSRSTVFAHGVAFQGDLPVTGLTDAGRALVDACNRLGILLDVSHINPAGFWDVLAQSRTPVVASHSSVKAFSPHVRNLDDEQVKAIAKKGGTIGLHFAPMLVRPDMTANTDYPIEWVVRTFEHVINLVGDEHASFGTDFDGAPMPDFLKDAAGLPVVLRELKRRGWSDGRMERVCNGNFLRVMGDAWR